MPPLQDQDRSLAADATKQISALLEAHACSICHDLLHAPVSLPCSHIFCSECARRHLATKSFCPHPTCRKPSTYMQLTALREYDISLERLRRTGQKIEPAKLGTQERLVFLSRKACPRAQFMERLRTHNIPANGGIDTVSNRYNEFVIKWNANLDAGVPKSKKSVVDEIMSAEREAQKQSRKLRGTSSFFTKALSAQVKQNIDIPTQGDDFKTLVQKTKARMERKRRLMANAQESNKLARLATPNDRRVSNAGSQGTSGSDSGLGFGAVSQPLEDHPRLQLNSPDRILPNKLKETDTPVDSDALTPAESVHVPSQCLSIEHRVCSLDITGDKRHAIVGNFPQRTAVQREQHAAHNAVRVFPQFPAWSQTTPDKKTPQPNSKTAINALERQIKFADDVNATQHSASFNHTRDTRRNKTESSTHAETNTVPDVSAPLSGIASQPGIANSPVVEDKHLTKSQHELTPEPRKNLCGAQELGPHVRQNTSPEPQEVSNSQSEEITPTRAQLERAERNRIAALNKRKRFYERQRHCDRIRQPDL